MSRGLIFVYGTLLRGGPNNHLLASKGAEFICAARTKDKYWMISNETSRPPHGYPYPYLVLPGQETEPALSAELERLQWDDSSVPAPSVALGEVYRVDSDTLNRLDELEGVEYARLPVSVEPLCKEGDVDGAPLDAEVYLLSHQPTMAAISATLRQHREQQAAEGAGAGAEGAGCPHRAVPLGDWARFVGGYPR